MQVKSYERNQIRQNYLNKLRNIESITKRKKNQIKRLEEVESSVMTQLKNTTMLHNFVQSRFEEEFWPGLSISSNVGAYSYRAQKDDLIDDSQINGEVLYQQFKDHNESNDFILNSKNRNDLNLFFSPSNTAYSSNIMNKKLAPFPGTTKNLKSTKGLNQTSSSFKNDSKTRNEENSTELTSSKPISTQ